MTETLYRKVGRKYFPAEARWEDKDRLAVGEFRLTYCYATGGRRYEYNVLPATAPWVAAAMIARHAMEEAIKAKAVAKPHGGVTPYTKRQQEIIQRFRTEMSEAGGLMPEWWDHASAYELSQAAIKAVEEYKP